MAKSLKYGIVGSGRAASHILYYFSLLELPCNTWSKTESARSQLVEFSKKSDVVLVLINDDAIEQFIDQFPDSEDKTFIHFSGSLVTEKAKGAHPLVSFGNTLFSYEEYKRIPFLVDEDFKDFKAFFPKFENPHYFITKENKPLYHALCVMSGNFTSILWSKFFGELEDKFKLPHTIAHPYLDSIYKNLMLDHKSSLTGPLVRKDNVTVQKNLKALSNDPFAEVYKAFVEVYKAKEDA